MKSVAPEPEAEAYGAWLEALKTRIRHTQARATLAVNSELVLLYWHLGRDILEHQENSAGAPRSSIDSAVTCCRHFLR